MSLPNLVVAMGEEGEWQRKRGRRRRKGASCFLCLTQWRGPSNRSRKATHQKRMLHYERGALSDRECNHVVTGLGELTLHWLDMALPRRCCYVQGYCRTVGICSVLGAGMLQLKGLLAAFWRARHSSAEKSGVFLQGEDDFQPVSYWYKRTFYCRLQ